MVITATSLLRGMNDSKLDLPLQSFINGLQTSFNPDALLAPVFLHAAQPLQVSIYGAMLDDHGKDLPGVEVNGTSTQTYTAYVTLRGLHDLSHHSKIIKIESAIPKARP